MTARGNSSPVRFSASALSRPRISEEISVGEYARSPNQIATSPSSPSVTRYGTRSSTAATSGELNVRPMKRLTDRITLASGRPARPRAGAPTSSSPRRPRATTDGVDSWFCRFGTISASPRRT